MSPTLSRLIASAAAVAAVALALPAAAALKPGAAAPAFSAQGGLGGKTFSFTLADQLKKGPVVLYFFPAAFTSGCTKEAHDFAEASADFQKLGATIVGVTAGNADRVVEFSTKECRDKFAVLADPEGIMSFTNPLAQKHLYALGKNRRDFVESVSLPGDFPINPRLRFSYGFIGRAVNFGLITRRRKVRVISDADL
jgi:peroxiredoxin Q/BCP